MTKTTKQPTPPASPASKMGSITIEGTKYNLLITMGAFLTFKRLTGREAAEIAQGDASDTIVFVYCILTSTARREGRDLPFTSVEEFADRLTPEDFATLDISL